MKRNGQSLITRLAVLLLAVLLVPVLAYNVYAIQKTVAEDPECYKHGDVNGDGIVDSRDAVQILYHSIFDDDTVVEYPVNQDCDFNGDGKVDNQDAIYVLYGSFQLSQYPLEGQIHQFYEPEWNWTSGEEVEVTFKCGCGQTHSFTQGKGITITSKKTVEEKCLSTGEMVYTATVNFGGEIFADTFHVVIPATGHQMTGNQDCDSASSCANCEYTLAALGHNWQADAEASKPATCQSPAVEAFKCSICGDTKTNTLEGLERHDYVYAGISTDGCVQQKIYKCSCGAEVKGAAYTTHTYVASIEKEATCTNTGVKEYTCSKCSDSYKEEIPVNDAHDWDAGVTENGVTTYTCGNCGSSKTAVVAEGKTATVAKETLRDAEVQVNNAAIKLDEETLKDLGDEVKIDVELVDAAEMQLDEELKKQIGENPVYDFTLSSDQTQVSQFAGSITISLPYTLQAKDDVDCIDVWFINDEGKVECVMGTYSNGQVTFTTDHFSYYTVTRLSAKQRCEQYGHLYTYNYKAPTCTANGQDIQLCKRCGFEAKNEVLPMTPHKFVEDIQNATCTADGYVTKTCPVCKLEISGVLPSLGHNWVLDESESQAADCYESGWEVYDCEECGETYRKDLAQLEHQYRISAEFLPDCVNPGQKTECCDLCGDIVEKITAAATGHSYRAEDAIWEWAPDGTYVKVILVCEHDVTHTKELTAVVGRDKDTGLTCGDKITYKAVASLNGTEYTDTLELDMGIIEHNVTPEWHYDEESHYHQCQACKQYVGAADHEWDDGVVIVAETCGDEGLMEYQCIVCGATKQEEIPATGDHLFEDGVCTVCGMEDDYCDHILKAYTITVDNEKWGICEDAVIEFGSCKCGQYHRFLKREGCELEYTGTETITTNKGEYDLEVYVCRECGLTNKIGWYEDFDEENCLTIWYDLYALYMDDELIDADYSVESGIGVPVQMNHLENEMRWVDLPAEGICSNMLMETYCYCGEYTSLYPGESECQWEDLPTDSEDVQKIRCTVCGLTRTSTFGSVTDGCQWTNSRTYTYELDGEEFYSFKEEWGGTACDWEIADVEFIDGSCENGVMVLRKCSDCGNSYWEHVYDRHAYIYEETISVVGDDLCFTEVTRYSCACGEVVTIDFMTDCIFEFESNEDGTEHTGVCVLCGMTRNEKTTFTEKDSDCNCIRQITYTLTDPNGKKLYEGSGKCPYALHELDVHMELVEGATTCESGVVYTEKCRNCDYEDKTTYCDHLVAKTTTYEAEDYGMCGGTYQLKECLCGQGTLYGAVNEGCNWQYHYDGTSISWHCDGCNTTKVQSNRSTGVKNCALGWESSVTYSRDGQQILKVEYIRKDPSHRLYSEFDMDGESCCDGYTVFECCKDCMYRSNCGYYSDHEIYVLDRENMSQGKLCGERELITEGCACGQEKEMSLGWREGACDYMYIGEDPNLKVEIYRCKKCGVEELHQIVEEVGSTECEEIRTDIYTYRKKGVNLFNFQYREIKQKHDYVYTFHMFGETCDDGYTVTGYCLDCGMKEPDMDSSWFGCAGFIQERDVVTTDCGDNKFYFYSCYCGDFSYIGIDSDCNWSCIRADYDKGEFDYYCDDCGTYRYQERNKQGVPGSCQKSITDTYRFEKDGVVFHTYTKTYQEMEHIYINTYTLKGETCADGYVVNQKCHACGQDNGTWDTFDENHYAELIHVTDLTSYGMCGGYLGEYSCACGKNHYMNVFENECDWTFNDNIDEQTEIALMDCQKCGTSYCDQVEYTEDLENCANVGTQFYKYIRNGEMILYVNKPYSSVHHACVYSYELDNPGLGCADGYEVYETCAFCSYSDTFYDTGCYTRPYEYVFIDDVAEQACGGYIVCCKSACGEEYTVESHLNCNGWSNDVFTETDEQGVEHIIETNTCVECGLIWEDDTYTVEDAPNCQHISYETVTVSFNDVVVFQNEAREVGEMHTYESATYEFLPGSVTCDDGLLERAVCKYCGNECTTESYDHMVMPVEEVDLQNYGAVCQTKFVKYQCLCGAVTYGELVGEEKCDMGEEEIDVWIEGAVENTWQDSTEGDCYFDSDAWILTCAVTDPQCAFKIRKSVYYIREGCEAVQYEIWQFGYDEATGTFRNEVAFATGKKGMLHSYGEGVSRYQETGENSYIDGLTYTCTECQSTYYYETVHEDGKQLSYKEVAENTLNNGKNKRRYYIWVDEFFYQGMGYTTYEAFEYIRADGSEFWDRYETEYDFSQGCNSTVTHTASDGTFEVYDSEAHRTNYTVETIRPRSCSQFGEYIEHWHCMVCGEATDDYTYIDEPTCHLWDYYEEPGLYKCSICGLENVNGSSGSIVMEDMTDRYGSGINYVVGYWNQDDISVHKHVSVLLKEADEGADDELILFDIAFTELDAETDGITAVTFSQADVAAKALAAMEAAGYTGDYAIRFVFVPTSGGDTLDYAITFDSLSA